MHYQIEKQVDGRYQIAQGRSFADPKELIEYYQETKTGFTTLPKVPCLRSTDQEAIAFRGLSYTDLHSRMEVTAKTLVRFYPM